MTKTVLVEVIREGGFDRSGGEMTLMTHSMTEAEWEELQRQAQLGRMVERMAPGDDLYRCNNGSFAFHHRRQPDIIYPFAFEALTAGGISDE